MNEAHSIKEAEMWFQEHPGESILCMNEAGVSKICETQEEAEELFSGLLDFGNT